MTPPSKPPAAERELPTLEDVERIAGMVARARGGLIAMCIGLDDLERLIAAARLALPESRAGEEDVARRTLLARCEGALEIHAEETASRNGGPPVLWETLRNDIRHVLGWDPLPGSRPTPPQAPEESGEVCGKKCWRCDSGKWWDGHGGYEPCCLCGGTGKLSGVAVARAQSDDSGTRGPPLPDQSHETGRTQAAKEDLRTADGSVDTSAPTAAQPTLLPAEASQEPAFSQPHETGRSQGREVLEPLPAESPELDYIVEAIKVTSRLRDALASAQRQSRNWERLHNANRELLRRRAEELATEKAARGEAEKRLTEAMKFGETGDWNDEAVFNAQCEAIDKHQREHEAMKASLAAARALPAKWRGELVVPNENGVSFYCDVTTGDRYDLCPYATELEAILNPSAPATERGKQGDGESNE